MDHFFGLPLDALGAVRGEEVRASTTERGRWQKVQETWVTLHFVLK